MASSVALRLLNRTFATRFAHRISNSPYNHNENNYIYQNIHKRLEKFSALGKLEDNLPISCHIRQLKGSLENNKTQNRKLVNSEDTDHLLTTIRNSIKTMNQQELAILLTSIKHNDEDEFKMVKRMIDMELRWLLKKHVRTRLMDLDLWFYLADTFYECLMDSKFVYVLVEYMSREKEVHMTKAQFLHLLFLVILQRDQRGVLSCYEERILQTIDKASYDDIATICMAYFKTKTGIENVSILRKIINRTIELIPQIDPTQPGYCAIIKSIRYSKNLECRDDVLRLVQSIFNHSGGSIVLSSSYNIIHTLKLLETYRLYDVEKCDILANCVFDDLKNLRIKDIQYALTSLSNISYKDLVLPQNYIDELDKICDSIVEEIRPDSDKQYVHLIPLLRAYIIFGYYNDKFIRYINNLLIQPSKVELMSKAFEYDKTLLLAYVASHLESAGEKIKLNHRLKKMGSMINRRGNEGSLRKDSTVAHLHFLLGDKSGTKSLENSRIFRNIAIELNKTKELKDKAYHFNFQFTMPHQNYSDLIISKNCPSPGDFHETTLLPKILPRNRKYCLLFGTRQSDYVDGSRRMSGYKGMVGRLLAKLGYVVFHTDIHKPNIRQLAIGIETSLSDIKNEQV